jgi:hypothetical protein
VVSCANFSLPTGGRYDFSQGLQAFAFVANFPGKKDIVIRFLREI